MSDDSEILQYDFPRPQNFAFAMNVLELVGCESCVIAPGHVLRRATAREIQIIRHQLERFNTMPMLPLHAFWECAWPPSTLTAIPEDRWRYFVVAFEGTNATVEDLQRVMDISPVEIELAFTAMAGPETFGYPGFVLHPGRLFQQLHEVGTIHAAGFFQRVTVAEAETIRELHELWAAHTHPLFDVARITLEIGSLKTLPSYSPLRFLGLFAVLESILTHVPKPSDPYDSITRQVKNKLTLLNNRWQPQLDYGAFRGAPPAKVWGAMYSYRSALAHGGTADFRRDHHVLGNHEQAISLLRQAVKNLIVAVLREPQLLADLRDC